ncbi:MAG: MFS transporter, partial [Euryarchaeota archaeon]
TALLAELRRVPRDVWLLGAVSLINDVSSEGIFAILPYYLTLLGGGPALVGGTWGGMELVKSLLNALSGRAFDRPGRAKPAVAAGYALSACVKLLLSLTRDPKLAALTASLERVGKGLRTPPRDAILAGLAGSEPGLVFGVHRTLDTLGAVIGPLAAGLLLLHGVSATSIILLMALIGFLSLAPLAPVEERLRERSPEGGGGGLPRALAVMGLYRLGAVGWMLYSLRVVGARGPAAAALAYAGFSVLHALASLPAGRLSDRLGPGRILTVGYALTSLSALLAAVGAAVPAFVLYGLAHGIVDAVERAAVAELSGTAPAYGAYHTLVGLATFACGVAAGWLWERFSSRVAFGYSACLTALAAGLALVLLARADRAAA